MTTSDKNIPARQSDISCLLYAIEELIHALRAIGENKNRPKINTLLEWHQEIKQGKQP